MILNLKTLALLSPLFVSFFWMLVLLSRNKSARQPGFYIAVLMATLFVMFCSILPFYTGNLTWYALLDPFFFLSSGNIFPFIWLYVRSVSARIPISIADIPHFIAPVIFFLVSGLIHLLLEPEERYAYAHNQVSLTLASHELKILTLLNMASKIYILLQVVYYFTLSQRLIKTFKKRVDDYFSDLEEQYFRWIRAFYFIYISSSLPGIFMLFLGNEGIKNASQEVMAFLFFFLSFAFFVVGFIANHQRYIESGDFFLARAISDSGNKGKEWQDEMHEKLSLYFQSEKPFLNPDLKITQVAQHLNTNRTYLSGLVHDRYGLNFSHFVNRWRIEESVRMFRDSSHDQYSTRGISELCGFNNYNTFTTAFKCVFGVTPARYREKASFLTPEEGFNGQDQSQIRVRTARVLKKISRRKP